MDFARKIVLITSVNTEQYLEEFVQDCIRSGVDLISIVGIECSRVHDLVDDLLIIHSSAQAVHVVTNWYEDDSVAEVIEETEHWVSPHPNNMQVIPL